MIENFLKATGEVSIKHFNAAGDLVDTREIHNLVVTSGLDHIAQRLVYGDQEDVMTHMGLGTGSATPTAIDTALGAQNGARLTFTSVSVSGAEITYSASFGGNDSSGAITEAGIFNSGAGGSMLCRTTFAAINKAVGDTLAITWKVTISASA